MFFSTIQPHRSLSRKNQSCEVMNLRLSSTIWNAMFHHHHHQIAIALNIIKWWVQHLHQLLVKRTPEAPSLSQMKSMVICWSVHPSVTPTAALMEISQQSSHSNLSAVLRPSEWQQRIAHYQAQLNHAATRASTAIAQVHQRMKQGDLLARSAYLPGILPLLSTVAAWPHHFKISAR